jgi:OOP family OmpA-OmpF porin
LYLSVAYLTNQFIFILKLRTMKKKSVLLVGLLSMVLFVGAQTADKKVAVGLYLGKNEHQGDLGNAIFNLSQAAYMYGGLSVATYLSPSFDLSLQGNYGDYGFWRSWGRLYGKKYEGTLSLHYKFNNGYILKEDSKLSPFVELGFGIAGYSTKAQGSNLNTNTINTDGRDYLLPLGVGLKYQFTKSLALQYKFVYNFTDHDVRDRMVINGNHDKFAEQSVGVIFSFGSPKDTDGDGVADKLDKCPNTPAGVAVDALGCPVDSDNDGVADYLDKCSGTPADVKVDAKGCPVDSDGDGVADYLDKCSDTPAGVKVAAAGCPIDTDGDGVADYLDKCPNTIKGTKVSVNGCAIDTDGDGVADDLDKCPDVAGIAANNGCPEEKAKVEAPVLKNILFESGKTTISKSSNAILDEVIKTMKANTSYNLEIDGHADNVGAATTNLELSKKRAAAVKTYLTKKKVAASRLTTKGFGETLPVADNSTEAGKAKNRRVEFKVNF